MINLKRTLQSASCTAAKFLSICATKPKKNLTSVLLAAVFLSSGAVGTGATMEWTWMGGTQGPLKSGIYGTKGTATAETRPGARNNHAIAKDAGGTVWIFGGDGHSAGGTDPEAFDDTGPLNDLWKRDASTGHWTWMAGSNRAGADAVHGAIGESGPDYAPAARSDAALWADNAGTIWLFGGSEYSDVWKFSTASAEWTWVSGPATNNELPHHGTMGVSHADNTPGAREPAAYWSDDAGNLWIFGGYGAYDDPESSYPEFGSYNDLWKYDIGTNEWVWVNGPSIPLQFADYGTLGVPSPDNIPGSRSGAASWRDSDGNFWMFGGTGRASTGSGMLGDLWKYDVSLGQWTWVSGTDQLYADGLFGTQDIANANNRPGGLQQPTGWADDQDNFWIFGGYGSTRRMNTLWKFTPDTGEWTWVSGGNTGNETGVYGTLGVTDSANAPGAREAAVGWADSSGNLWIFGGGHASRSMYGYSDLWRFDISDDAWAWEGGEFSREYNSSWSAGNPGSNVLPEAARAPGEWTDKNGNLWMFSGPYEANMWKYSMGIGQWAWMRGSQTANAIPLYGTLGVPDEENTPGGRESSATWTDKSGNFWLFGGLVLTNMYQVTQRERRNDLWKFDPSSQNWTWISGNSEHSEVAPEYGEITVAAAANIPGGRERSATWVDSSGNLWLFGGYGIGEGASSIGWLNDLWKYNITTGMWTWMSGGNTINQFGNYGDIGESNPNAGPGGRENPMAWADNEGNLWLFGGYGYADPGTRGMLNDLWKYDISTGEWTWMHGSDETHSPGMYGALGVASPGNMPPARSGGAAWRGSDGKFWLFGGTTNPFYGWPVHNDLWVYNPATEEWTWMDGSNDLNQRGVYGSLRVSDGNNMPGARGSAANWTDAQGNFWIFGGVGFGLTDLSVQRDLWRFSAGDGQVIPTAAQDWALYD